MPLLAPRPASTQALRKTNSPTSTSTDNAMSCRGEHVDSCGHGHDHGHGEACDHEAEDPDGQSMYAAIDTSKVRCLNESELGAGLHPFKPYSQRRDAEPRLDSHDDDPELLLFVPFTRVVKLKSINIIGGHAGEGTAPAKIKLFLNRDDVDFSNCGELPAVQELELVADAASLGDGGGIDYPLKVSKFQNVDSLTIFFCENGGGDVTSVSYVGFKGEVTTARHGVVECVYESAPQAADHKQDAGEFLMPDVSGN